jgi:RNA polymerase sporulation-specific sigma factor
MVSPKNEGETTMKNEKLVIGNMKLVHAVINRLFPAYRTDDDVIAEGLLGLVKAANTFDEDSSVAFSTYAFCAIRNEIISYLRRERRFADVLSLDEPIGEDGEGNVVTLADTIASEDAVGCLEHTSDLDKVFSHLKERDKIIVVLKLRGLSNKEIAEKVHTGVPNVRRVLRAVHEKMRDIMGD